MITERDLTEGHASFWGIIAPNLTWVLRGFNLSGRETFAPPLNTGSSPERNFYVNEVAFRLAVDSLLGREATILEVLGEVYSELSAKKKVGQFERELSHSEHRDAREIAARLRDGIPGFITHGTALVPEPSYPGLGALARCTADLRYGRCLVEVKSGDRSLRSIDFRQVLIYHLLSAMSEDDTLHNCLIINPRQGYRIFFEFSDLVAAISGKTIVEFSAQFRDYLVEWEACD